MTNEEDVVAPLQAASAANGGRYGLPELFNGSAQSQCLTCWAMVRRGDEPAHDQSHGLASQPPTSEASPQ